MLAKSGGTAVRTVDDFANMVLYKKTSEKPIQLVLFSAPWCGPCRLTIPVVKEIMKQFSSQIDVFELSTDDLPEVAERCNVQSIPTIQLYHDGKIEDTIVGCVAKNVLAASISTLLEEVVPS
jgi:thioredoxin 1